MGHANNAVYSTYLEQARIATLGGARPVHPRARRDRLSCRAARGRQLEVRTRCSRVGTKSFELEHEIWAGNRLAADAKSVLVGYDYERASVPLSDDIKRRLSA
jgi:acyl-CoA thioester hydrolase